MTLSEIIGSFIRTGNFPLEADYVFESEQALREWAEQDLVKATLHEGLFKIVKVGEDLELWWVVLEDEELKFVKLLSSTSEESLKEALQDVENLKRSLGTEDDGSLSTIESEHLQDAESIVDALKILDELVSQTPQIEISLQEGNGIILKSDGLYYKLSTEYNNGILTIRVNNNIVSQHNMTMSSIVEDAYYDSSTEEVVIVFKLVDGSKQTIRLNVATLIREWDVDNNNPSKVVELTREEVFGGGPDRLSADVRISNNPNNILTKDGNTLLVEGLAKNILTTSGQSIEAILSNLSESFGKTVVFNTFAEYLDAAPETINNKIVYIIESKNIIYNGEIFLDINDLLDKINDPGWYEELDTYTIYFVVNTGGPDMHFGTSLDNYQYPVTLKILNNDNQCVSFVVNGITLNLLDIEPFLIHEEPNYIYTSETTKIYKITLATEGTYLNFYDLNSLIFSSNVSLYDRQFYTRNALDYYYAGAYSYDGSLVEIGDFDY